MLVLEVVKCHIKIRLSTASLVGRQLKGTMLRSQPNPKSSARPTEIGLKNGELLTTNNLSKVLENGEDGFVNVTQRAFWPTSAISLRLLGTRLGLKLLRLMVVTASAVMMHTTNFYLWITSTVEVGNTGSPLAL